jgi:outer membrane receptor protein involved in Fe transport
VEHATIQVTTFDQFQPDAKPTLAKLDNVDLLPAATATFKVLEDFQLRGGYSRTLNRPDLRELSPSQYNDLETNSRYVGNPALKRARIDNYDARVEWYLSADETFSVGGFYKSFQTPIEMTLVATTDQLYMPINSKSAQLKGLEFDGRKRFNFIDDALETFYFAGNLSLIDSTVHVLGHTRPLQSQSPWVVNAQLGWDDSLPGGTGTVVTLLYNVAGKRMRAVGDPDSHTPDQYEMPFHRLDLVASQEFKHGWRLGGRVQNMLNPTQIWKQGDIVVRSFKRGVDFAVSVAWSY